MMRDTITTMKDIHKVTFLLLIVGGLNWLLVGIWGQDIGAWLLGGMDSGISRIIYVLVGLSAIYEIVAHKKLCRNCNPSGSM